MKKAEEKAQETHRDAETQQWHTQKIHKNKIKNQKTCKVKSETNKTLQKYYQVTVGLVIYCRVHD